MKGKNHSLIRAGILLWALFFLAPLSFASSDEMEKKPDDTPTFEVVKEKVGTAAESVASYTVAQRNQAIAKAKKELQDLDRNIEMLEEKIARQWDQLSEETKQRWQKTLTQLRKKRIDAAEWYGGVRRGSADAWEEIKKGYAKAYSDLDQSWKEAKKEFTDHKEDNDDGQQE